jgi:hypothetical protein
MFFHIAAPVINAVEDLVRVNGPVDEKTAIMPVANEAGGSPENDNTPSVLEPTGTAKSGVTVPLTGTLVVSKSISHPGTVEEH